jgi:hypothetical protein
MSLNGHEASQCVSAPGYRFTLNIGNVILIMFAVTGGYCGMPDSTPTAPRDDQTIALRPISAATPEHSTLRYIKTRVNCYCAQAALNLNLMNLASIRRDSELESGPKR